MKESNESFAASALSGEAIPTAGDSTNTFSVSQPAVKTLTNVKEHEIHLEGAFNVRDMGWISNQRWFGCKTVFCCDRRD